MSANVGVTKFAIPIKQPKYFVALNTYIDIDAPVAQRANTKSVFDRIGAHWAGFREVHGIVREKKSPEERNQAKREKQEKQWAKPETWDAMLQSNQMLPELKVAALKQKRALENALQSSAPPKKRRVQENDDDDEEGDGEEERGSGEEEEEGGSGEYEEEGRGEGEEEGEKEREEKESAESSEPFVDQPDERSVKLEPQPPQQSLQRKVVQTRCRAIRQQAQKKIPIKMLENMRKKFNDAAKALAISRDQVLVQTFEEIWQAALTQNEALENVEEIVGELDHE